MKSLQLLGWWAALSLVAPAATTISDSHKYTWAGNLGWTNWRDAGVDGVVIGEYVCSGYLWSANCGWIHLGDGTPANGIRYANTSAADYGVNLQDPYTSGGTSKVKLRGFGYAANLGWVNFESVGNPEISLQSGRLTGYAWSANGGWINLNDSTWYVASDTILPGADSDGDGIADAFEFEATAPDSLTVMTATGDCDGDGCTDLGEYIAATNPMNQQSRMCVRDLVIGSGTYTLTWDSSPARLYRISTSTSLLPGSWTVLLDGIVPDGGFTSRTVTAAAGDKRFFRVEAYQPLAP